MTEPIPSAKFSDPLLKERSRRRTELFVATLRRPFVIVGFIAALALYFVWPPLIPIAWVAGLVVSFVVAGARASAEWWFSLLRKIGMTPDFDKETGPFTPLLRSGDERKVLRAGGDGRRQLMIFRSTDVSRDSKGNRTESNHDYTVVLIRDAAPAIRFLSAHEHRVSFMKFLGDDMRGRAIGNIEEFKVESVQLHERFELRSSTEDGQRARQIFKPTFIQWFTASGVPFEYENGTLVVFADRVLEHSAEFEFLLKRADAIHAGICGEPLPTG